MWVISIYNADFVSTFLDYYTYNKNEPKKDEPKKDDTKPDNIKKDDVKADNTNTSSTDAPKTGDNENYAVWAILLLLSGSAVAVLLKMKHA